MDKRTRVEKTMRSVSEEDYHGSEWVVRVYLLSGVT